MKTVKAKALIEMVAEERNIPKKDAKELVEYFVEKIISLTEELDPKEKEYVEIGGLGKFMLKHKEARDGINPLTKEKVKIAAYDAPVFKPAKSFKERIKNR